MAFGLVTILLGIGPATSRFEGEHNKITTLLPKQSLWKPCQCVV